MLQPLPDMAQQERAPHGARRQPLRLPALDASSTNFAAAPGLARQANNGGLPGMVEMLSNS